MLATNSTMTAKVNDPTPQADGLEHPARLLEIATRLCAGQVNSISEGGAGANSRILKVTSGSNTYALKFYRDGAVERCSRLIAESKALLFMAQNQVVDVPQLIATDMEANCALMEWLDGSIVESIGPSEIQQTCRFIEILHDLRYAESAGEIAPGVDQCLSGADLVQQLNSRLARLRQSDDARLHKFLDQLFVPLLEQVVAWSMASFDSLSLSFSESIDRAKQTLSPVDFGLHNALRRKNGNIAFLDFEYFGWADPVQLVVDTLQHPGMSMSHADRHLFFDLCKRLFVCNSDYYTRVKIMFPLFGLRWCTIMLNAFLPRYRRPGDQYPHGLSEVQFRKHQLELVVARTEAIQSHYKIFPYSDL